MRQYEAWFDGSCWPNPNGHAGCGAFVRLKDGLRVFEHSEYLGSKDTSNNVAEYCGLIAILKFLRDPDIGQCEVVIYGDSDMVIKQMTKVWRAGTLTKKERNGKVPIRPRYYLPYYQQARELLDFLTYQRITFKWIPREQNTEADALSTKVLREKGYRVFGD